MKKWLSSKSIPLSRLNHTLVDLDHSAQEKVELTNKIIDQNKITDELQRKLDKVSNLTSVLSKNLQDDLKYERDLNSKLKEELLKQQKAKETMTKQISEAQLSAKLASEANDKLTLKIQEKEKIKKQIESDNAHSEDQITALNEEIDNLKSTQVSLKSECISYQEEIDRVEAECANVEAKLQELQAHYNQFVETNTKTREELCGSYNQKISKLSANLLFILVKGMLSKRVNTLVSAMKTTKEETIGRVVAAKSIYTIACSCRNQLLKAAFRKYVNNSMKWKETNNAKVEAIDKLDSLKLANSTFAKWRKIFTKNANKIDKAHEGAKLVARVLNILQDRMCRASLINWMQIADVKQKQILLLKHLLLKKAEKCESMALCKLLGNSKKINTEIQYSQLASEISQVRYQMKVCDCLFTNSQNEKNEKTIKLVLDLWAKLKLKCRSRFLKSSTVMIARMAKIKQNRLLNQAWSQLKCHSISGNITKLSEQLNNENDILKETQFSTESTKQQMLEEKKNGGLKKIMIYFRKRLYSYFDKWMRFKVTSKRNIRSIAQIYKRNAMVSKKNILQKWHHVAQHDTLIKMQTAQKKAEQVADDLQGQLESTKESLNKLHERFLKRRSNKLRRVIKQKIWKIESRALTIWSYINKWLNMVTIGYENLEKLYIRKKEGTALNKYRSIVSAVIKNERLDNKLNAETSNLKFWLMVRSMKDFKKGVNYQHREKHLLTAIAQKKRIKQKAKAFQIWTGNYFKSVIKEAQQFSQTAHQKEIDTQENINKLNNEISSLKEVQKQFLNKETEQSKLIIATNNARKWMIIQRLYFRKWRACTANMNKREAYVKLFTSVAEKGLKHNAMVRWILNSHRIKEAQIKVATVEKLKKIDNISKTMATNEAQCNQKLEEINNKMTELSKQQQFHDDRIEGYSQFMLNRLTNYTHQKITRNVLQGWKKVVQNEKNLLSKVMDTAYKFTSEDIFMKMKQKDLDIYSMQHTISVISKMLNKSLRSIYRGAFRKWQNYTKTKTQESYEQEKAQEEQKLKQTEDMDKAQDKTLRLNAEQFIKTKKLQKIFTAYNNQSKQLKLLKDDVAHFKNMSEHKDKQEAMQLLKYNMQSHRKANWEFETLKNKSRLANLQKTFQHWHNNSIRLATLPKIIARILERNSLNKKSMAFASFASNMAYSKYAKSVQQKCAIRMAMNCLIAGTNRIMLNALLNYRYKTMKKAHFLDIVKKLTLRRANYKMRDSFNFWKNKIEQIVTVEKVNNFGSKAKEVKKLEMKLVGIQKVLEKEGYQKESIQKEIDTSNTNNTSLIKEALNRWEHYQSTEDPIFEIMRKWKDKCLKLSTLKRKCGLIFRQLSKGDSGQLQRAFRKWKYMIVEIKNTVSKLPKKDIVKKVINDRKEIDKLQKDTTDISKNVVKLEEKVTKLEKKYTIGKQVIGANLRRLLRLREYHALFKWRANAYKSKKAALKEQLDKLTEETKKIADANEKLEKEHDDLLIENEEMRQTSLDSIEIANAIQDITREREQLSADLSKHSLVVRRLVEENEELSQKLVLAQKEANNLVKLTQSINTNITTQPNTRTEEVKEEEENQE